jgi:hypothetical protein
MIDGIGVGSDSPLDLRDDGMQANLDGQTIAQLEDEEQEINNLQQQLQDKKKFL